MAVIDFNPRELIDEDGYENLRGISRELHNDWDYPGIIVGRERTGKSTFAAIATAIVDPTFCTNRVVFPTVELQQAIQKSKPYQGIIQDEGAETWLAADTNSREAREIKRLFMMMGFKRLWVAILIPDIRMVEKYLKTHRAKFLIRIRKRGVYEYFSDFRIPEIRVDASTKAVKWPSPSFRGWFREIPKESAFWKAYLEKKARHISNKSEINPKIIEERMKIERLKRNSVDMRTAGQMIGVSEHTVRQWIKTKRYHRKPGIKPILLGKQFGYRLSVRDVKRIRQYRMGSLDSLLRDIGDD